MGISITVPLLVINILHDSWGLRNLILAKVLHYLTIFFHPFLLQLGWIIVLNHVIALFPYAVHGDRIAGFLFEPIQGEAGVCAFGK